MMLRTYEALTTAAGLFNFRAGEEVQLKAAEAKELLEAGAIRSLEPEPEKPKRGRPKAEKTEGE